MRKIKSILSGFVPGCGVMVYGSRTAANAKSRSYLDLAIMVDKPLGAERMKEITAAFTTSGLPFPVALVDWADTGSDFRKEIKRTAILIR